MCVCSGFVVVERQGDGFFVHFLGAETRHAIRDDTRLIQRLLVLVDVLVVARCLVRIYA
jgi:hypothetical protein